MCPELVATSRQFGDMMPNNVDVRVKGGFGG
jgi:hypothetical protein